MMYAVEREMLILSLAGVPGEAFAACGDALRRGAEYVVWDHTIPASQLARSYARRELHMRKVGTPTVGFADAVARLAGAGDRPVRTGEANAHDPPYHFQLFLEGERVIACLGVLQGR